MKQNHFSLRVSAIVAGLMVQGAAFAASDFLDQGGKAHKIEVRGTQAILIGLKGQGPAPDGVYRGKDGKTMTVKNGNVVQGVIAPIDNQAHKGAIKGMPDRAIKGEAQGIVGPLDSASGLAHKGPDRALKMGDK